MLAYVFWHRPGPDADAAAYEQSLRAFHRALAADPPTGFHRSVAFARAALPWFDGYEDWYLVDGWAALGAMNAGAVDATHSGPHDAVAGRSVAGAGAVFRLVAGPPDLAGIRSATWSDTPVAGDVVWRRQLVLGPAPQHCALHREPAAGPIARRPL